QISVAAFDQYGNVVTNSTAVTLTLNGWSFSTGSSTVTATTIAGVATFSGLMINKAGQYTLTASAASVSGPSMNLTVTPGAATQLVWQTAPSTTGIAGTSLGSIVVLVEDAYGNIVTGDNSSVTLTLSTNTFSGGSQTATVTASGGVATFSNLA